MGNKVNHHKFLQNGQEIFDNYQTCGIKRLRKGNQSEKLTKNEERNINSRRKIKTSLHSYPQMNTSSQTDNEL